MDSTNYAGNSNNDCDLCKQVLKKLGPNKISEPLRNELAQVNANLKEATEECFKYQIVVDCVKKLLDQKITDKTAKEEGIIVSDPLYLTLAKKYSSADGLQPFGVTEDFIDKTIKKKQSQKTQAEQEELNEFVEEEIENFCEKISDWGGYGQRFRGNRQRAFEESVKALTSEFDELAVAKGKLESEEKEINDLRSVYFENLLQGVSMLKTLISLREKNLEFQSSLGNLYAWQLSTLVSKMNNFEHEVLAATYKPGSVQALSKIRMELDEKKATLDDDLNTTNSELQTYSTLGPKFEELVDRYTELQKQIQYQKWAIEALKRRQSLGGSLQDETASCSEQSETESCSEQGETASCNVQGETVDCSEQGETATCNVQGETVDCSVHDETVNHSVQDEAVYCSVAEGTMDRSVLNESVDRSVINETVDCLVQDETVNCSVTSNTNYFSVSNDTAHVSVSDNTFHSSAPDDSVFYSPHGENEGNLSSEGAVINSYQDEINN